MNIREDIENIIKKNNIDRINFSEISKQSWESILKNIEDKFADKTNNYKNGLYWANVNGFNPKLKSMSFDMRDCYDWYKLLPKVFDDEFVYVVWTDIEKDWIYEERFKELAEVLEYTEFDDDYYIVSKKYKWLVSLNHHDIAIFTGDMDFEKVKKVYNEYYLQSERP